jgi:hypothetical protein
MGGDRRLLAPVTPEADLPCPVYLYAAGGVWFLAVSAPDGEAGTIVRPSPPQGERGLV